VKELSRTRKMQNLQLHDVHMEFHGIGQLTSAIFVCKIEMGRWTNTLSFLIWF
jgi:hypothetical protein